MVFAFDFNHNADALSVGFVANVGNAFDCFVAHQFGDAGNHRGFVDLIRNFRHDNRPAVFTDFFNLRSGAHNDGTASRQFRRTRARSSQNQSARRKIGSRNDVKQFFCRNLRIVDIGNSGINHFPQVMRRNVGRHTYGNTFGAVHQKVGDFYRQNLRLFFRFVKVRNKIHHILVQIRKECFLGNFLQSGFRITHGSGAVAFDVAEVAVAVD